MKRTTLRKSFLVSGVLLFLVLVLGQSTWACDEPDYNDYMCVEELDIKKVRLDFDNDLIYIFGKHFDNGGAAYVALGDIELIVKSHKSNEIITNFPGVEEGQYKLRVSTGDGYKCKDKYSVKIDHDNKPSCPQPPTCQEQCPQGDKGDKGEKGDTGLKGEQGPQGLQGEKGEKGDIGPRGPQGIQGAQGPQGLVGPQGPQGETGPQGAVGPAGPAGPQGNDGATGATGLQGPVGPQGPAGLGGTLVWQIVPSTGHPNVGVNENQYIGAATCGTGYQVTGGGFWQHDLDIRVNGPFEEIEQEDENGVVQVVLQTTNNGWYVSGTQKTGTNTTLIVYAICAKVN